MVSPRCFFHGLLVVFFFLCPPLPGARSFRLGKQDVAGTGVSASSSSSSSASSSSKPSGGLWGGGGPKWSRMLAEAWGTGEDGGGAECHAADELMRKRGPENYRKALGEYKALLAANPTSDALKLKLADASVSLLRSLTNANAVLIDGISDSEANRQLWKEYAFEAYDLLKALHKARPNDAKVHVLMTEAYTYRTSSKGILKAAVTGDGLTFMKLVSQIVAQHPTFDAGVPFIFRGVQ